MKLFSHSSRLVVVALLLLVTVLAACGDTPTAVPAATPAAPAATTAAAMTTAAMTTAAMTTSAAATTAAMATTAAAGTTTAAMTTSAAMTTAASGATTAATGTSTGSADIPAYPGATEVTLPDAITSQFASSVGSSVKNAKVIAYKTSDSPDTVTSAFKQGFSSDGWTDLSASIPAGSTSALSGTGLSLIGPYSKGTNVAVVMVGTGALFATAGVTGVTASDTVYLLFQGTAQ